MKANIVSRSKKSFKVEIEVKYSSNMLEAEELIQQALNKGGEIATQEAIKVHDTDGSPIIVCGAKFTTKGKETKEFQTPYGPINVERHVYQSSQGGKTYAPMDVNARIINTSTPKFAKIISSKYSNDAAPGVQRDLFDNHGRTVALSFIKNTVDAVGSIAEAKEETWHYELPDMPKAVKSISIGLDGTCLNMIEDGWREAMCGTIALFDRAGERMHTIYISASPEYGKETFFQKFAEEIKRVTANYPKASIIGLADGAASNWRFLKSKVDSLLIDFWHVSEYLSKSASSIFPKKEQQEEREDWLESVCDKLKHNVGSATRILNELKTHLKGSRVSKKNKKILQSTVTYFRNHKDKMVYHKHVKSNMPI